MGSVKAGNHSRLILAGVSMVVIFGAPIGPHLDVNRPHIKGRAMGDGISAATEGAAMLQKPPLTVKLGTMKVEMYGRQVMCTITALVTMGITIVRTVSAKYA